MKKWTDYIDNYSKEQLQKLYVEDGLSKKQIATNLGICLNSVRNLLNHYNITRNNSEIVSQRNHRIKDQSFRNLLARISADDLYTQYITQNKPYNQLKEELGITGYTLDKLLAHYGIHKTRKQSSSIVLQSKLNKYGSDNFNNWQKGHLTRIKNSGSLKASYDKGKEAQRVTNLQRYGVECYFSIDVSENAKHRKYTKPNEHFLSYLTRYSIPQVEREFTIETKSYDFKVANNLIEINPTATHNCNFSPFGSHQGIDPQYHLNKSVLAKKHGYRCIHVWDWDDLDKIVSLLQNNSTLYARKCSLQEVSNTQCDDFLNKYHLQGSCRGQSIRLGLFDGDELIQIMTFGKPRYNKKFSYELLRLCTKPGYKVVGGAQRLFSHFRNSYNPLSVISYCDLSKFTGDVYLKLGMHLLRITNPTRHWYNLKTGKHFTDAFVRQHGADQLLGTNYGIGTNNSDILRDHGFVEVYDCGQAVYTLQ